MNVLFPFGFGLSYSEFKYDNLKLSKEEINENEELTVTVDITNIGKREAKEAVELYVKNCESDIIRPIREFKGFDKVNLLPGETKTVTFKLNKRSFAYFDERIMDWAVPSGTYEIEIGKSSRDIVLSRKVNITSTPILPDSYDYDTIMQHLLEDKRIEECLGKYINFTKDDREKSDVEKESMNEEMESASFLFSPLRSGLYFSAGKIRYKDIDAFLEEANRIISDKKS